MLTAMYICMYVCMILVDTNCKNLCFEFCANVGVMFEHSYYSILVSVSSSSALMVWLFSSSFFLHRPNTLICETGPLALPFVYRL